MYKDVGTSKEEEKQKKIKIYALRQGLLNLNIDEITSPSMASFLKTSCTFEAICLADLLPSLSEDYPKSKVQLTFTATRPPVIVFSSKDSGENCQTVSSSWIYWFVILPTTIVFINERISGRIFLDIKGIILVYMYTEGTQKKQAAVLELDVVSDNQLLIKVSWPLELKLITLRFLSVVKVYFNYFFN